MLWVGELLLSKSRRDAVKDEVERTFLEQGYNRLVSPHTCNFSSLTPRKAKLLCYASVDIISNEMKIQVLLQPIPNHNTINPYISLGLTKRSLNLLRPLP